MVNFITPSQCLFYDALGLVNLINKITNVSSWDCLSMDDQYTCQPIRILHHTLEPLSQMDLLPLRQYILQTLEIKKIEIKSSI